jgi:tripartite-type tricarboxylate transporter receptor subunit TctC
MNIRNAAVTFILAGSVAMAADGRAAEPQAPRWPVKPIRMVVPFPPGGSTDIVARILAPSLSEALGQQFIVDNRSGAAGNIALDIVARAQPDGYTTLIGNVSTNSINETLFTSSLKIKPSRDLIGVTLVGSSPNVLVSGSVLPPNNLKELIAYLKSRPGQVNFTSPLGSQSHLDTLDFLGKAGLEMPNVPTRGIGQALASIIAGDIHISIQSAASAIGQIKGGKLKAYATTAPKRLPELPEVPTFAEEGMRGVGNDQWTGLFVPAATPRAVIDRLHASLIQVMQRQDVRDLYNRSAIPMATSRSPEEFNRFVQAEIVKWAKIIKDKNVTVE